MAGRHRTIDRVAAIMELAAAAPERGITLAAAAQELNAPKSSLHGLISGLLSVGYLAERDGRYTLGPGLNVLVGAPDSHVILSAAIGELERLQRETGETVLLGERVGHAVIYTKQLESHHQIRYAAPMHVRRPILTTSMGKLFLAELDDRQVRRIARAQATDDASDIDALLADLTVVRERGYAVNHLVVEAGITALAAGIRDRSGNLIAAIAVRGPSFRMKEEQVEEAAGLLTAAADRVSAGLQPRLG